MEKELEKLGLTENEGKVYLLLLQGGPLPAGQIAHHAGLKRPTTYLLLRTLEEKGLVVEIFQDKKRLFNAETPEKLKKLTKKMRRQVIAAEMKLEELLPVLQAFRKKLIEAPKVSFHQGKEGMKNILEQISECREPWYFFGSAAAAFDYFPLLELHELMEETSALRDRSGRPKVYFITDKAIYRLKQFQTVKPHVREIKTLPQPIDAKSAIAVFGDRIAVVQAHEPSFAAVIESTEVAEIVRLMFMTIWQSLPS